jgi:outer membrane protein assembly factor BamB
VEDVFDRGFEDDPATIVARDGRVFVGGWTTSGDFQNRHFVFLVRAYDGKSGTVLWQDLFDYAGIGGAALSIVVEGQRVFAAGWVVNDVFKGEDLFLRAYDAASGRVLWQDRLDTGFGDEARVAVAADGRVYVGGTVNTEFVVGGAYEGIVRSYRARNGRLVWEADDIRFPLVDILGLAVGGGRVFAVGGAKGVPSPGLPSSDFFAAAVDAF